MSSFNTRADQLRASQVREQSLKDKVGELATMLAVTQDQLLESQPVEVPVCDIAQLNADLKDAKFCAETLLGVLNKLQGRSASDAFCVTPEKARLYNSLLCIAQADEFEARCQIAAIELQIYKCTFEEHQVEKEEAVEEVNLYLETAEVDDKQCAYYISTVMNGV